MSHSCVIFKTKSMWIFLCTASIRGNVHAANKSSSVIKRERKKKLLNYSRRVFLVPSASHAVRWFHFHASHFDVSFNQARKVTSDELQTRDEARQSRVWTCEERDLITESRSNDAMITAHDLFCALCADRFL